jgi:hypothetical protein
MTGLTLTVPTKRHSAWVAETDPRYARAWFESLPLADVGEVARELYQTLYTLNRQELPAPQRLELMELYESPVATAISGLQNHLGVPAYPLSARKHQLAQFIRQLDAEMANGYKCCLQDLIARRFSWRSRPDGARVAHRALYHLSQLLFHSYRVYLPYPTGVWREIHQLFSYAESAGWHDQEVDAPGSEPADRPHTIARRYRQALMLAASQPYQLPQDECLLVNRLIDHWSGQAALSHETPDDRAGLFLIDPDVDSPPQPAARMTSAADGASRRVLNTLELVRTLQGFVHRLSRGESVQSIGLGVDCLDTTCHDMLQRLIRAWSVAARRQHSRLKRRGSVLLCVSLPAVHFFASGQRSFSTGDGDTESALVSPPTGLGQKSESEMAQGKSEEESAPSGNPAAGASDENGDSRQLARAPVPETFRVDRWQIRDLSPQGLLLSRPRDAGTSVRVGDVLGVQRTDQPGSWSAGVVRWLKSPSTKTTEIGVELLGPQARPVEVRLESGGHASVPGRASALILPAILPLHRPATLLVPRGLFQPGATYELREEGHPARRVRALQLVERSGSFEQVVFADASPA